LISRKERRKARERVHRRIGSLKVVLLSALMLLALALPAYAYSGLASWYDIPGGITASGDRLTSDDVTCASNDYPMGSYLNITYRGVTVTCVVTDTGGFTALGRDVDLNYGTAVQLPGFLRVGVDYVGIEYAGQDSNWYYGKQY
jgi:rare lipoprotein A (peptidoglycan hydrolase)